MTRSIDNNQTALWRLSPKKVVGKDVLVVGGDERRAFDDRVREHNPRLMESTNIESLPIGQQFDYIVWSVRGFKGPDVIADFRRVGSLLKPDGEALVELELLRRDGKEVARVQWPGGPVYLPTPSFLYEEISPEFPLRIRRDGAPGEGKRWFTSIISFARALPTILLMEGTPKSGKTALSRLLHKSVTKVIRLDDVLGELAFAENSTTRLGATVKSYYGLRDHVIDVYAGIDKNFMTEDFAALVAEYVSPNDRLVVIEGAVSKRQLKAIVQALSTRAKVWTMTSSPPE